MELLGKRSWGRNLKLKAMRVAEPAGAVRWAAMILAVGVLGGCGGGTKAPGTAPSSHTAGASTDTSPASGTSGGVRGYTATGSSMLPTIGAGQTVVVDPNAYSKAAPKVGDIVVFYPPADAAMQPPVCGARHAARQACPAPGGGKSSALLIRRIVAGPGDTIKIINGRVIRNGARESGEHIKPCRAEDECDFPAALKLPVDDYFMMGDNRGSSDDSRFWGPVPQAWIVGKVVGIVARAGAGG
jgi:signal peptidase I